MEMHLINLWMLWLMHMVNFYVEFNFQILHSNVLTRGELYNYLSFVDKYIKWVVKSTCMDSMKVVYGICLLILGKCKLEWNFQMFMIKIEIISHLMRNEIISIGILL